jgi:hypothetical protein
MSGELRGRAGEAWRAAASRGGYAVSAPAFAPADERAGGAQDLIGAMFSTPKELRHLAEQQFGEEFVPTRVLAESAHFAVFSLDAGERGQVVVHAERDRHWYPFRITRVEPATAPQRG